MIERRVVVIDGRSLALAIGRAVTGDEATHALKELSSCGDVAAFAWTRDGRRAWTRLVVTNANDATNERWFESSFADALRRCVALGRRTCAEKEFKALEASAKAYGRTRGRATRRRDDEGDSSSAIGILDIDALSEILNACDGDTRRAAACVSRDFREAAKRLKTRSEAGGSGCPRVACSRCEKYMWRREAADIECISAGRVHALGEALHAGRWKRAFRRELRRRGCRYVDEDSDESTSDDEDSDDGDDENVSEQRRFWNFGRF